MAKPVSASSGVCYSVEPVAVPPMTDGDPSANILRILEYPSVGLRFTVEIHLRGATLANVAAGIVGLEVHLDFTDLLAYASIVGFTDSLGQVGGALNAPVLECKAGGIYKANGLTKAVGPLWTGGVQYIVAACSTGAPWNAADGLVAVIEFCITRPPTAPCQLPLTLTFSDLADPAPNPVAHEDLQGTLEFPGAPPPLFPWISVTPQSYTGTATLGSLFNYSVVAGFDSWWDVAGFDVTVSWNSTLISLVDVFEGGFLWQGGASTSGWINSTVDSVEVNYTKLSNPTPSTGTDSLFLLEFNVTYIALSHPTQTCAIALGPTDMISWSHPERPVAPWFGGNSSVDLSPVPDWYIANATYTAPAYRHDVGIGNVELSKTVVGVCFSINISVTAMNDGDLAEVFNVTVYANSMVIGAQQATLNASSQTTFMFFWNTTSVAYGNYTISANASAVPGETNTTNNNFSGGVVAVSIPGDVIGGFEVNLVDLVTLALAYGSHCANYHYQGEPASPNWNPNADITNRGVVNLQDLLMLANHYGQHYP